MTDSTPPLPVPLAFVRRAEAYTAQTGQPLLEYRAPAYATTLRAWPAGDEYNLSIEDYVPPFGTWRELAAWKGLSAEALCDEHDLEPEELDDAVPDPYDYFDEVAPAAALLRDLGVLGARFTCPEEPEVELGRVELEQGGALGRDYYHALTVTSPLALACLQHVLDARGAGVRLEIE